MIYLSGSEMRPVIECIQICSVDHGQRWHDLGFNQHVFKKIPQQASVLQKSHWVTFCGTPKLELSRWFGSNWVPTRKPDHQAADLEHPWP